MEMKPLSDASEKDMCVLLNEENLEEFCWDPVKVMEELGIKRSRLNQIAGQELRVGKIRQGSYMRSYFCPKDVLAYKEWTRTSLSKQKSLQVLEQARENWELALEEVVSRWSLEQAKLWEMLAHWHREEGRTWQFMENSLDERMAQLEYKIQSEVKKQTYLLEAASEEIGRLQQRMGLMSELWRTLETEIKSQLNFLTPKRINCGIQRMDKPRIHLEKFGKTSGTLSFFIGKSLPPLNNGKRPFDGSLPLP